jgi:hypothetical protein
MDYGAILKKSWTVTWRYKILWLFGLFAGAGGGGFNYSISYRRGLGNSRGLPSGLSAANFEALVQRYAIVLVVVALFLIVLGVLMLLVSVAARGGLIHLINEAEEGREVHASAGWRAGFSKWWRVFAVGFLADLPLGILAAVFAVFVAVTAVGTYAASSGHTSASAAGAAIAAALGGLCCFAIVFVIAAIVLGTIFGIVKELALRYAVLEDRGVMDALKTGWHDLWAKRGAFLMYLIQVGVGIAYGIVAGIVAVVLVVPAALMMAFGNWVGGSALILLAILVLIVPSAIYGTFYHAVWTIFFRRMTGAEKVPVAAPAVGYPPAPPVPYAPPAPPEPEAAAAPEPPAEPDAGSVPEPPAGDDA